MAPESFRAKGWLRGSTRAELEVAEPVTFFVQIRPTEFRSVALSSAEFGPPHSFLGVFWGVRLSSSECRNVLLCWGLRRS